MFGRARWVLGLLAVVAIVAAGVAIARVARDDGNPPRTASETPVTTASTAPVTTASAGSTSTSASASAACDVGGSTTTKQLPAGSTRGVMTAIAVASPPPADARAPSCATTVTVTFRNGGEPGLAAEYVDPPIYLSQSDMPANLAGSAFLVLRFDPAEAHNEQGQSTMTTPLRVTPNSGPVRDVRMIEDFEGIVRVAIGLDASRPFTVTRSGSTYLVSFG